MYSTYPAWVMGFHGCDEETCSQVLVKHECLHESRNDYDWLGAGIYFWENNPLRAYEFAVEQMKRGRIKTPGVVGAMIDLHNCLDLTDMNSLILLKSAYPLLVNNMAVLGAEMPKNSIGPDRILRKLDCAVIEMLHGLVKEKGIQAYDSVRGAFFEGERLYNDAGFTEKCHIQLCVRNEQTCIKGYFKPRLNLEAAYRQVEQRRSDLLPR